MGMYVFQVLLITGLSSVSSLVPRYYYYVNEPKTWSEAQSYCREKYTDLATVDNMEEMKMVMAKVIPNYSGSVFIGLKRGNKRRWGWSSGDEISQYHWYPGEPNNGDVDGLCGAFWGTGWIDFECEKIFGFVCYTQSGFNRTFTYVSNKLNWRSAQTYCRQKYTDLVTISNIAELQSIANLLNGKDYTWIGLFYDLWEWSDQWSTSFRNWRSGQPWSSTGSTDCVTLVTAWQGQWDDTYCYDKLPFVCYKALVSRSIVKLKIISEDKMDLNNYDKNEALLNQIKEKLRQEGIDIKVNWKEKNGKVFQSVQEDS